MKGQGWHLFYPPNSRVVNGRFLLADGKWYPKTMGCRTYAAAKIELPRIVRELSEARGLSLPSWHPDYQVDDKAAEDDGASARQKGVVERARRILRRRIKEGRWKSPHIYESALNYMERGFGEYGKLDPKKLTRPAFVKLREFLTDCPDIAKSASEYGRRICQVLVLMPEINPEFIKILRRLPKDKGDGEKGDQFQEPDLRTILIERKKEEDETTRILIEIGLDDGPQVIDAACIPISGINFQTGFVSYRRVKSREEARFQANPYLLKLLRERREKLRPGAAYLLEDIMFTQEQRADPKCNTARWDDIPKEYVARASTQASNKIRKFLRERCKFDSEKLSYKSFRIGRISFWALVGFTLKSRMRMAGHASVQRHVDYDRGSEIEIRRAAEVSWRYYEAVEQGRPFHIPSTMYDLYEFLKQNWDALPNLLRQEMRAQFSTSFALLEHVLLAALAEQKTQMERKIDAQNQLLREISCKLDRNQSHLGALANHCGAPLPIAA